MSQPAPKPGIWQFILIATVVFLGIQIFFAPKPTDKRTPDDIMQAIRNDAKTVKDRSAKEGRSINMVLAEMGTDIDLTKANDKLSADQDLEQLMILHDLLCDQSSPKVLALYENKIDSNRALNEDQKVHAKVWAEMLVADTQKLAASQRQEVQRITFASDTVIRLERTYSNDPVWTQPIALTNFNESPQQVASEVHTVAEKLGRETLVWGFFPGYQMVDFLIHITGAVPAFSYWFGALLLAICVRTIIWPLSQRQMMWSRQMSQLTPLVNEIKDQFKGKQQPAQQQEMQKKIMGLYQEYGMNPMAGCLPAFLQLPLFLIVYQSMLHYRFDFQNGFFAWINPTTSAATHGFIARNLGEKDYILIVVYGISMVVTALLAPVSDPTNMRQQRLMGISFAVLFGIMMFFWPVPSAFILYWVFTNILATAQSLRAYRLPLPPLVKKNAPNGGVYASQSRPGLSKEGLPSSAPGNGSFNGKPKSTGAPKIHKPKKRR